MVKGRKGERRRACYDGDDGGDEHGSRSEAVAEMEMEMEMDGG